MSHSRPTQTLSSKRAQFMGLPLDCLTFTETLRLLENAVEQGRPTVHCVINAGKVVAAQTDPSLLEAIRSSDIVNADGQSVVWLSRMAGLHIPERVTGIDLMEGVLHVAARRHLRVYLLGARADVLERAKDAIVRRYPDLGEVGGRDGYFSTDQTGAVVSNIALFHPDVLFIGMSTPQKEVFAHTHGFRLNSTVIMGVGGALDIWAGETRRAPPWMRRSGLEWLFRVIQEPRRMWRRYLFGNITFAVMGFEWLVTRRISHFGQPKRGRC